jgi:hypothetical protein
MSSFPSRRINVEDLRGAPEWAPVLIAPLNLQNEDLVNLLNGKLQVGSNINGQIYSTSFVTPTDYLTGGFVSFSFTYSGKYQPSAVLIGALTCTKPAEPIITATSLSWSYLNGVSPPQVKVSYVAGLKASHQYSITVIAL